MLTYNMSQDHIDYEGLIENALRGVVRDCLATASEEGLPGAHHFYITFLVNYPGVILPQRLKEQYPQEMTIVLQNRFWDLQVDEDAFSVGLSFSGIGEIIVIPFEAITGFADPSVNFGLRFEHNHPFDQEANDPEEQAKNRQENGADAMNDISASPDNNNTDNSLGNVVSLDAFRRKR